MRNTYETVSTTHEAASNTHEPVSRATHEAVSSTQEHVSNTRVAVSTTQKPWATHELWNEKYVWNWNPKRQTKIAQFLVLNTRCSVNYYDFQYWAYTMFGTEN